ncbi:MAG TPA: putative glycolipid-binding domain-containing protein [Kaistia sp.]|nr:putative glycolipid-binding domain-containing protein [Kaistia sp.]
MSKAVRWKSWDGNGIEHLVFADRETGISGEGAILSGGDAHFAATYEVACHASGTVARAQVAVAGGPKLTLQSDGDGKWRNGEGKRLTSLAGALDVDFSASPFTNTLPIRRLGLAEGQSGEVTVLYVRFPDLELSLDRQRYTCLERDRRYRYEAADGSFEAEIEVDGQGLVTLYDGLFRRIL